MTVEPQRWSRAYEILVQALECAPDRRSTFVAAACGTDEGLRREVESLLETDPESLARIDDHAFDLHQPPASAGPEGVRIGPFEVVRELGRGGTGTVFLAKRTDGEPDRRVALKILDRGVDGGERIRRFRTERRILASFAHPNIARFDEAGTTADGRPYLVMELVEGEPIDGWCDRRRLSVTGRLELFLKVCAAVQFAHQSLVIHRDLKPSNILVGADGEPKLLDFGIAKPLDRRPPWTLAHTDPERRPMTPGYASPEQVAGDPMTTASDVYSLGVVLYLLLTGRSPYRIESGTEAELRRAICEQLPQRPSRAVRQPLERRRHDGGVEVVEPEVVSARRGTRPRRLARRLAGDLDTIVLTALHKSPRRRYATAELLARDLRRYLRGLPVLARPDTLAYRAAKLLWRRRRGVAVAAAAVLLAGFFLADRAQLQRRTAHERDRAEEVSTFLVELFEVPDGLTAGAEGPSMRQVLDRGVEKLYRELGDQPELEAAVMAAIGRGYRSLGLFGPAEPLLEGALQRRRRLHPAPHRDVARALSDLGALRVSQGDFAAGEALHREALEITLALFGEAHPRTESARNALGAALMDRGKYDEAAQLFGRVVADQRLADRGPRLVAAAEQNLGLVRYYQGSLAEAEVLLQRALSSALRLLGAEHPQTTAAVANLAAVLRARGDHAAAEPLYRWTLDVMQRRHGDDHPAALRARTSLAALLLDVDRLAAAEDQLRGTLASWKRRGELDHPDAAAVYVLLSAVIEERGDPASATVLARQAVALRLRHHGPDHPLTAHARLRLASALLAGGDAEAAEAPAREGTDALRRLLAAGSCPVAVGESTLGAVLAGQGRYREAESLLVESYRRLRESRGETSRSTRVAGRRVLGLYRSWGRPGRADLLPGAAEAGRGRR